MNFKKNISMKTIFIFLLSIIFSQTLFAQCSDAGICIIGKKPGYGLTKNTGSFSIGSIFGATGKPFDIKIHTFRIEGDVEFSKVHRVGVSIPFGIYSGKGLSNSGIGDLSIVYSYHMQLQKTVGLTFSLGGKFATGKFNSVDSLSLAYQPGLGTNDLLVGAGLKYKNYNFAVGYQHPFGRSKNYSLINSQLKRGDDIFLRAGINETFNKINLKAEILAIKRLGKSNIFVDTAAASNADDEGGTTVGYFREVDGSAETQINILGTFTYNASKSVDIQMQIAKSMLQRDFNLDGLKRNFTIGLSLIYNFSRR